MSNSTDLIVHRSRFYKGELSSINSIAYNEKLSKVALLRRRIGKLAKQSDVGSIIEIWNLENKASFMEQKGVVWSKSGRLFSCGLNTYVNEYDLEMGCIRQSHCVNSSPAWCLSINKNDNLLAIGTENGFICLYNIEKQCFQYEKILDRIDNRILCLDWYQSESGELLIGGSIDYIKIWNVESGRCVDFIKVGKYWHCRLVSNRLSDFTIVSGDSSGTTSFWNGKNSSLTCSFKAHKADVLALCKSTNEINVFSSGIDPTIIEFRLNLETHKWISSTVRRWHTHDVRSLVFTDKYCLLSGGVDSIFVQSWKNAKSGAEVNHLSNFGNKFATTSIQNRHYLAMQYETSIQIWLLGRPESDIPHIVGSINSANVTRLNLANNAIKLLEISSRKPIVCFAFNPEWIVYANNDHIKIMAWSDDTIEKVKLVHDPITNIRHICLDNGNRMAVNYGRTIETFKLDKFGVLAENARVSCSSVHQMLAADGKLIVSFADEEKTITIYDAANLTPISTFPNVLLPISMKVDVSVTKPNLWIAFANAMILQYDLRSNKLIKSYWLSKFKSNEDKECQSFNEHWPIKQIAFGSNMVLFSNDHNMYSLNLQNERITKCDKYRHILFLDNLTDDTLVLIELTPEMLLSGLPKMLKTKKFGTG
ncbi:U3 small nucleolar RNA-associated protein 4 [Blomia tropicalis]|nr:U3 small nucleolar RNA-associated protein 4 [Blomia tropicalis]